MNVELVIIVFANLLIFMISFFLILDIKFASYTKRSYAYLYWILDNGLKINFLSRHKFKFNNEGRYLFEYSLYCKFIFKRLDSKFQFIPFFEIDNKEHIVFNLCFNEYIDTIEDLFKKKLITDKELSKLHNIALQEEFIIYKKI
jgi:hypothetical protein